jgi:protocatechuate 3,4-dioxygenase beta subunit
MKTAKFPEALCSVLFLFVLFIPASAQQKRGAITGRIVAEDGAPMSGITVMLGMFTNSPAQRSTKTALTDEEGNFQFTNLPPSNYYFSVMETRGYVQPPRPANAPQPTYRLGENAIIRMMRGGVITGRVSYASGEPMIGVYVTAFRVRDAEGNPVRLQGGQRSRLTDDRGIYRLYGLQPGTYVVVANYSGASSYGAQSPFDGDAPTYHPSATRDTAAEVSVSAGAETSGIDIRHRGDRGHAVSGRVTGGSESTGPMTYLSSVTLLTYPAGMSAGNTAARPGDSENGFSFLGIPDGEYEIEANRGGSSGDDSSRSEPRRVTVRGGDVTGIEVRLLPMASIAGRVVLEPAPNTCDPKVKSAMEELLFLPRREEKPTDSPSQSRVFQQIFAADEKGEFKMTALPPGRYRIAANLPNENWFVKSITSPGTLGGNTPTRPPAKPAAATDLARTGATLKSGEKLSGVTVTVADGAADLRGKVAAAKEGSKLPARLRVHLVPAETTAADEVLRYAETLIAGDGAFAFANLAPGKYWLLARAVSENEPTDRLPQPVAWDAAERAKLRKDAEAAKNEIELKTCQRVKDHMLRF